MNDAFLTTLFKVVNDHMRTTERKYLIITGAFIGLFSILVSTALVGWPASGGQQQRPFFSLAVHLFLLVTGSFVYVMQNWYRAWKEHYLDVSLAIRQKLLPDSEEEVLPYWLRREVPERPLSVDNLLKLLTIVVNLLLVTLISIESFAVSSHFAVGITVTVVLGVSYLIFLYTTDRSMRKGNYLYA